MTIDRSPTVVDICTPRRRWRAPAVAMLLALASGASNASDAFTDALQIAYGPYRAALFATNQKSVPDAQAAVEKALSAWQSLMAQVGSSVPAPYDRDTAFAQSLQRVNAIFGTAGQQVKSGALPQAHDTLEEVRDVVAELRHRNGVVVYSDHMNAYHAHMEHLLGRADKLPAAQADWMAMAAQVGVLEYLAEKLDSQAPAALKSQPEFVSLLQAVRKTSQSLQQAVQRQDSVQTRDALGQLKGPYSRLFLKFG
jgi:hypothetical protein